MMGGSRPEVTIGSDRPRTPASIQPGKLPDKPVRQISNGTRTKIQHTATKPKNLIAMPVQQTNRNFQLNSTVPKSISAHPVWHGKTLTSAAVAKKTGVAGPPVRAKALYCVDCSSNKVMLAENTCVPLPIASISKLVTAMIVVEEMDLDRVVEVPGDISQVERHVVGIKPGDQLSVRDLLHGLLIESGNDCAETLARAYPKGSKDGFVAAMNRKAVALGATTINFHTPSGLDSKTILGRKDGRYLEARKANTASAEDVAVIARAAFKNPLISKISSTRTHTMRTRNWIPRDYALVSNDKLLAKNLPLVGAKTGYTNQAGRCIVALFKDKEKEHMVVVLNSPNHFQAAEKVYRWAHKRM